MIKPAYPKTTLNNVTENNTLTVYFEQYTPKLGDVLGDGWFRVLNLRQTQPDQIKVVIDGASSANPRLNGLTLWRNML